MITRDLAGGILVIGEGQRWRTKLQKKTIGVKTEVIKKRKYDPLKKTDGVRVSMKTQLI